MRYRDRETGQFVSKSTWKRSKAQGGTRYVREKAKKRKIIEVPTPVPPEEPEEDIEYEGAFDSP